MTHQLQSCLYTTQGEYQCQRDTNHQNTKKTKEAFYAPLPPPKNVGVTFYGACDFDHRRRNGFVLDVGKYDRNMTLLGIKKRISRLSGYDIPYGYKVTFTLYKMLPSIKSQRKSITIMGPALENCFATSSLWQGWNDNVSEVIIEKV